MMNVWGFDPHRYHYKTLPILGYTIDDNSKTI